MNRRHLPGHGICGLMMHISMLFEMNLGVILIECKDSMERVDSYETNLT